MQSVHEEFIGAFGDPEMYRSHCLGIQIGHFANKVWVLYRYTVLQMTVINSHHKNSFQPERYYAQGIFCKHCNQRYFLLDILVLTQCHFILA